MANGTTSLNGLKRLVSTDNSIETYSRESLTNSDQWVDFFEGFNNQLGKTPPVLQEYLIPLNDTLDTEDSVFEPRFRAIISRTIE